MTSAMKKRWSDRYVKKGKKEDFFGLVKVQPKYPMQSRKKRINTPIYNPPHAFYIDDSQATKIIFSSQKDQKKSRGRDIQKRKKKHRRSPIFFEEEMPFVDPSYNGEEEEIVFQLAKMEKKKKILYPFQMQQYQLKKDEHKKKDIFSEVFAESAVKDADIRQIKKHSEYLMERGNWHKYFKMAVFYRYRSDEDGTREQKRKRVLRCLINMPGAYKILCEINRPDDMQTFESYMQLSDAIEKADIEKLQGLSSYIIKNNKWHNALTVALFADYTKIARGFLADGKREDVVRCLLQMLYLDHNAYYTDNETVESQTENEKCPLYKLDRYIKSNFLNTPLPIKSFHAPALHVAAIIGDTGIFDLCMKNGADVFMADNNGKTILLQILLSSGIKREVDRRYMACMVIGFVMELDPSALQLTSEVEMVKDFLNAKVSFGPKAEDISALHLAIFLGQQYIAEEMLARADLVKGVSDEEGFFLIDLTDIFEGKTILHAALLSSNIKNEQYRNRLVQSILCLKDEKKEDFLNAIAILLLDGKKKKMYSALDIASKKGYTIICESLTDAGAKRLWD